MRAAVEEGIVAGGGTALLRCLPAIEKLKLQDDEVVGVGIVKRALEEPARQIAHNAGYEGAAATGKIRESKDDNFGFNADTDEYGDMVKAGVIDPAKVTRCRTRGVDRGPDAHHRSAHRRSEGRRKEVGAVSSAVLADRAAMGGMY